MELSLGQKFRGYPLGFDGFFALGSDDRVVCLLGWVVYLHTTKLWRGGCVFWLFVTMLRGRRDDDVRLRRLFVGERCERGVRRSTKSCAMMLLISPHPI